MLTVVGIKGGQLQFPTLAVSLRLTAGKINGEDAE